MKRIIFLALLMLTGTCWAQIQYPYILNPPTVAPSGACAGPQIQVLGSNGAIYSCDNGTWAIASGGGTGTVTSVTGTANQIDVATGTTTPVISLDPSLILPTGTTLVAPVLGTPASGVITNLTGTCTTCTANAASSATAATNLAGGAIGSLPYQSAAATTLFVSGNTTTTPQFVTSTGTGAAAQAPTLTGSTGTGTVMLAASPTTTGTLTTTAISAGSNVTITTVLGAFKGPVFQRTGTKFTATGCTSITATLGGAEAGKFTIGAASCTVIITINGATGFTALKWVFLPRQR